MHNIITSEISNNANRDTVPLRNFSVSDTQNGINTNSVPSIQVPQSSSRTGNVPPDNGIHLRAKLRFFYMSPCWKWHLKRQFPWKAWFQFIKIIIVTIQLILFGVDRQTHVVFLSESNITFHHLFVRNWDSGDETLPYPRASGDFAVYTTQDFMDSINYAVYQFNNLTKLSLGLFDYHDDSTDNLFDSQTNLTGNSINLCINRFKTCHTNPTSHTYVLDTETEDVCFKFNTSDNFDIEKYLLNTHNETIDYCGLNLLTMEFNIHAIQLKNQKPFDLPDCYHFIVTIIFDNNARTGKIRHRLDSQAKFRTCNGNITNPHAHSIFIRRDLFVAFDCLVLLISIISCFLCIRSLWSGHKLCKEIRLYYSKARQQEAPLTWSELQMFYSFWYFLMIVTDLLIIPGTIIKFGILFKMVDDYNAAGLLLGISSLFSWISILRYLSFFRKYNLLFLTIEKAFPLLVRFIFCTIIIYCGFMFCGWIVFGPYHTKFQSLSSTTETLFSLINGDDMYATFANLETQSFVIWLFSQIYLLSFISLFIYVVLSLFIALIIDGYETVKKYHMNGYPKSRLQKFSEENVPQWSGPEDWQDLTIAIQARSVCFPCCFKTPPEVTAMVARDTYLTQHSDEFR